MRAAEIIRDLLNVIDKMVEPEAPQAVSIVEPQSVEIQTQPTDDINHFKQIVDLISQGTDATFADEPNEVVADIAAVTTDAGGGVNGPKDPSDIRGEHPSIYPAYQYGVR
jgi:hypothetical protein